MATPSELENIAMRETKIEKIPFKIMA